MIILMNYFPFRDAPKEYSTVSFDMEPEILPEDSSVPINSTSKYSLTFKTEHHVGEGGH